MKLKLCPKTLKQIVHISVPNLEDRLGGGGEEGGVEDCKQHRNEQLVGKSGKVVSDLLATTMGNPVTIIKLVSFVCVFLIAM